MLQGGAKQSAIVRLVSNVRVGREHGHQRVAVFVGEVNGGEGDGGGGIASDGFSENMRSGHARNFAADGGGLLGIGDDPAISWRENGREAVDGFAKQGVAAGDIEQLLGSADAAAGPEASAAASG